VAGGPEREDSLQKAEVEVEFPLTVHVFSTVLNPLDSVVLDLPNFIYSPLYL
jgi:hypothetical protein